MNKLSLLIVMVVICHPSFAAGQRPTLNIALIHTFSKADPLCYDPYGKNFSNAVEMAWTDFKDKYPRLPFELRFTRYELDDNKMNSARMIEKAEGDGAVAALGLICSDFALLGGRRAQELGVPMITPTATDDRIADIGEYVFMALFKNSYQGEILARFAVNDLGRKRTLIIKAADCSYCLSLSEAYKRSFEKLGGQIAAEIDVLNVDRNFFSVAEAAKKHQYDSVLLANYAMQIAGIIAEMAKLDTNTIFLGGDSWIWTDKSSNVIGNKPFVAYSVAGWAPGYPTKIAADFIVRYKRLYGNQIVDTAAHSYDAAMLLFNAISRSPRYDRKSIKDALYKTSAFDGASGKTVFHGLNWPEHSLVVLKTTNETQRPLKFIEPK